MPKKAPKSAMTPRGKRGRKSIISGDDPVLEERCNFIAGEIAKFKSRAQILHACKEMGWELCDRQIGEYIAAVRKRWREENSGVILAEKKVEIVQQLRHIYHEAAKRQACTAMGDLYDSPDLWLMRQVILDIAKLEGADGEDGGEGNELDAVLDELTQSRSQGGHSESAHGSSLPSKEFL